MWLMQCCAAKAVQGCLLRAADAIWRKRVRVRLKPAVMRLARNLMLYYSATVPTCAVRSNV